MNYRLFLHPTSLNKLNNLSGSLGNKFYESINKEFLKEIQKVKKVYDENVNEFINKSLEGKYYFFVIS